MKKRIGVLFYCVVFFVPLTLIGCGLANFSRESNFFGEQKPALRQIDHNNSAIKMEVIDEIPSMGITVIRFIDAGHTRYIAVRGDQIGVLSETSKKTKDQTIFDDASVYTVSGRSPR